MDIKHTNIPLDELKEAVLDQLKEQGYKDLTLYFYRCTFDRICNFIIASGRQFYSTEAGEEFLASLQVSRQVKGKLACAVRRLDDFANGRPYRCHHEVNHLQVPECFAAILDSYLARCREIENRPSTVKVKRIVIAHFLCHLQANLCTSLDKLDAGMVSRALLIFKNKEHYSQIRDFLVYLADSGIANADLSGAVPSIRRKQILPVTYTAEEIRRVEQSLDTSSETGRRDLAMILLATRMGIRAGDIAKLKTDEIDFSTGYLHIIQEKTLVPLTLQMPSEVIRALKLHLSNQSRSYDDGYVFHKLSAPYEKVKTVTIGHAVATSLKRAGIDTSGRKRGAHAFRSSLASSMVNDGVSYETVRRILGHTDPNMIKHYAKCDLANLRLCAIDPPRPSGIFEAFLSGKKEISRV